VTAAEKLLHATDESLGQFLEDGDFEAFSARQQAIKAEIQEKGLQDEVSRLIEGSWARSVEESSPSL
jgi:hypothetical protein